MAVSFDNYIENVIRLGDKGSALLAARCAPTLRNNEFVSVVSQGMNGIAVLNPPNDYCVAVHSAGGDPAEMVPARYAASLVEQLVSDARKIGALPIGMADVIDASTGDERTLSELAEGMVSEANRHDIAILNGELAILGNRVNCAVNMVGTMVSLLPYASFKGEGLFKRNGVPFAAFEHDGKKVYMNSDGPGTKTEIYERCGRFELAIQDSFVMKSDDTAKLGAEIKVFADVVDTRGHLPLDRMRAFASRLAGGIGALALINFEDIGERIQGYKEGARTYNISGSAVSLIDEQRLLNLLVPKEGDSLIAIRGLPLNPRSNGITDKRKLMVRLFGSDWHATREGEVFLDYLAQPSTMLYPLFMDLIGEGLATAIYHNSGGAFNGKLAKPLANNGLFVEITGLFEPDWREVAIAAYSPSLRDAYAKCPMGTDGFIAAANPAIALAEIHNLGYEALVVGVIAPATPEKRGVAIEAYNGQRIYFDGT